jgi:Tol biopolymer transport system component
VSPDGLRVAYAADRMIATAYEVYVQPIDGSVAAVRVTSGTVVAGRNPSLNSLLQWNPDGAQIAFCADYNANEKDEVFVAPAAGGGHKRVAQIGGGVNQEAREVAWSPDSTQLAFIADHRALGVIEAFRINNITAADQSPILVHAVVLDGDMSFITWLPY